ncbi:hypothetical protein [Halofilum ochraceum]|uniref:hypothetical protein n=1 Tax=Halofilum ochraceum TaxID=1611323 RepID=UPI0008DB2553|nr:hypothetical protein [Halofilum ochraceum]
MARLQPGNFIKSAVEGYQMGKQIDRNEKEAERRDQQFQMEKEQHSAQMDRWDAQEDRWESQAERQNAQEERAQEKHEFTMGEKREQARRAELQRSLNSLMVAHRNGRAIDPDDVIGLTESAEMSPRDLLSAEQGQALDTLERAMKGEGVDQKDVIEAGNTVYRKRLQKGVGEKIKRDGKEMTVVDKSIRDFAPTEDGRGIRLRLNVKAKDKDGNVHTYSAPVTENRSAEDEYVLDVPVDNFAKNIKGQQLIRRMIQSDKGLQQGLERAIAKVGGDVDDGTSEDSLSASFYNSASRSVEDALATDQDQWGSPIVPEERRELQREATSLAHRLLRRSGGRVSPGEAANMAVNRVMQTAPTVPKHEARQEASERFNEQYDTGLWDGTGDTALQDGKTPDGLTKEEWIEKEAARIRKQSAPAAQGGGSGGGRSGGSGASLADAGSGGGGQSGRSGGLESADSGSSSSQSSGGGLAKGDVQTDSEGNKYRYTGGNPNKAENWEKVE